MKSTVSKGRMAEEIALKWLQERGFVLLERNFRVSHKEIDLIVESESRIHFVEVKSLDASLSADPLEKVDARKQGFLVAAASGYISSRKIEKEVQFDVITILFSSDGFELNYIPNAFWPVFYR